MRSLRDRQPIRLYSFWLWLRLRDRALPIVLVAVARRGRVRRLVGLALVLALLVVDDLRALAAAGEHQRGQRAERSRPVRQARITICPPAGAGARRAGAGAPALPRRFGTAVRGGPAPDLAALAARR